MPTPPPITLPDLNISVSRFYPFKRKRMVGKNAKGVLIKNGKKYVVK